MFKIDRQLFFLMISFIKYVLGYLRMPGIRIIKDLTGNVCVFLRDSFSVSKMVSFA